MISPGIDNTLQYALEIILVCHTYDVLVAYVRCYPDTAVLHYNSLCVRLCVRGEGVREAPCVDTT